MIVWVYEFEDGTKLELLNNGLSVEEVWKLKELHGEVKTSHKRKPPNSPYSDWGNIPMLNDKECEVTAWVYREIPEPYKKGE